MNEASIEVSFLLMSVSQWSPTTLSLYLPFPFTGNWCSNASVSLIWHIQLCGFKYSFSNINNSSSCMASRNHLLDRNVWNYILIISEGYQLIGLAGKVFANGPRDWGLIPGQVIRKTFKKKNWCLMPPCLTLSIIMYVSQVKWSNPGKGVAPSPTPQCSSYWKGSLWVSLHYSRQLYFMTLPTRRVGWAFDHLMVWTRLFILIPGREGISQVEQKNRVERKKR